MMNKPVYFYYQREDSLINALGKKHTYFLESVKRVKLIYEDFDKNIKDTVRAARRIGIADRFHDSDRSGQIIHIELTGNKLSETLQCC